MRNPLISKNDSTKKLVKFTNYSENFYKNRKDDLMHKESPEI